MLMGLSSQLVAEDCVSKYDSDGCSEVRFRLGDDMVVKQYSVIYDDDQDGVLNGNDKCLTTPIRIRVDENGCRLAPAVVEKKEIPKPKPVVVKPKPKPKKKIKVEKPKPVKIVTLRVNFETAKYEILEESYGRIEEFAEFMDENPDYVATIVGHTDSRGSYKKNKKLSYNRAQSVADMLEKFGVDSDRLKAIGVGFDEPTATNKTAEGRAANRRIEARVYKGDR